MKDPRMNAYSDDATNALSTALAKDMGEMIKKELAIGGVLNTPLTHQPLSTKLGAKRPLMSDVKRQLTHIEIRRAQNGFVVRGVQTQMGFDETANQVFYVCESVESLTNLLSSLARDEGDFVWGIGHDLKYEEVMKERR